MDAKKLTLVFSSGIILLLIVLFNTNVMQTTLANDNAETEQHDEDVEEITHEQIVSLTDQFMNMLVQDVDDHYKVTNYATIDELLHDFEQIATRETVEPYVDYYYNEESDGLYILPTETPPWFVEENAYDVLQLDETQVKVIQENQTVFYDDYTIEIAFTFDKEWKITNISIN